MQQNLSHTIKSLLKKHYNKKKQQLDLSCISQPPQSITPQQFSPNKHQHKNTRSKYHALIILQDDNDYKSAIVKFLCDSKVKINIKIRGILELYIARNAIGDEGVMGLAGAELQALCFVDFSQCQISSKGFTYFLFKICSRTIKGLISKRNKIKSEGFTKLISMLDFQNLKYNMAVIDKFQHLKHLDLEGNNIGYGGLKSLQKLSLPNLLALNLQINNLSNKCINQLQKSHWPKLQQLTVQYSQFLTIRCPQQTHLTHFPKMQYFNIRASQKKKNIDRRGYVIFNMVFLVLGMEKMRELTVLLYNNDFYSEMLRKVEGIAKVGFSQRVSLIGNYQMKTKKFRY